MRRMKKARQYLLGIFAALLLCGILFCEYRKSGHPVCL